MSLNKPKILLCNPKTSEVHPNRQPALSIFYPGAALEQAGFDVDYWDASYEDFSTFEGRLEEADIVGVTSMTGYQLKGTEKVMRMAKAKNKQVVMGGVHASIVPEQCIQEPFIDYVVVGEGENTLVDLASGLKEGATIDIPGVMTKDRYPGPSVKLDTEDYILPLTETNAKYFQFAADEGRFSIQTSRSCPYRCAFCYNLSNNIAKYHYLPLEQVGIYKERFPELMHTTIVDDWLGAKKRIKTVASELQQHDVSFTMNIRAGQIDEDLAAHLYETGCVHVMFGMESGSPRVLKEVVDKGETVESFLTAAKSFRKFNIRRQFSFILGMPGETEGERKETYEFITEIYNAAKGNVGIAIYNYVPFPGTPLLPAAIEDGFQVPTTMAGWSDLERNKSISKKVNENVFFIGGLTHHRSKGNRTDTNFPGVLRLLILPFELLCRARWKLKFWEFFKLEKYFITQLLKWRTSRVAAKGLS